MEEKLINAWDSLDPLEKYEIGNKHGINIHHVKITDLYKIKNDLITK